VSGKWRENGAETRRTIEDKCTSSLQEIERPEEGYQIMAIERREADKRKEVIRTKVDEVRRNVRP